MIKTLAKRVGAAALALCMALGMLVALPKTAKAANATVNATTNWSSFGGSIALSAGETLTIEGTANLNANGTLININAGATGVTINSDGRNYGGLCIIAGDGAEFTINNLSLTAPVIAMVNQHGILFNGDGALTVTGTCNITGSSEFTSGLVGGNLVINNSGTFTVNAGNAAPGILCDSLIYNGTGTMTANGSGGAGIYSKSLTQNEGVINANGSEGGGISSHATSTLTITVSDGILNAAGDDTNGFGIVSGDRTLTIINDGVINASSNDESGTVCGDFILGGTGTFRSEGPVYGIECATFIQNGGTLETEGETQEGIRVNTGSTVTVTAGTLKAGSTDDVGISCGGAAIPGIIMSPGTRVEITDMASGGTTTNPYVFDQPAAGNLWSVTNATVTGLLTDTQITAEVSCAVTAVITLSAPAAPTITSANNYSCATGVGGSFQVVATGVPDTLTYSLVGAPAGVAISNTGLITVASTVAANTYTFTVTAANGIIPDATQAFTLWVSSAAPSSSDGYFPSSPANATPKKAPFPCLGEVTGKRINVYEKETLKGTVLFTLGKGEKFTILGLANGGRAFKIEQDARRGYVAFKDIKAAFGAPIRATALKKAVAYTMLDNSKLKRAGYFPKDKSLWVHGITGSRFINKQTNNTYYLDAAQWKVWIP